MKTFLEYTRCIISINIENVYIPALHSNQSSLESVFSRIRFVGKDMTHLYAGGIVQQNIFNQIKIYQTNDWKHILSKE